MITKTYISSIPEQEQRSPKGRYHLFRKNISDALGGEKDTGPSGGGHPFEVELVRMPPAATNFPFHAHFAQWEMYVFVSGQAEVRGNDETTQVAAGDAVIFKPGDAHSIRNTGASDLTYYVIADNSPADIVSYPDTGKWGIKPQRKLFVMRETAYYEDED